MNRIVKYISSLGALLLLAGCTKNVNLNLPNPPNQVVVEGHIEPGHTAYAYVSHNFAFFGSTTVSSILNNDVIHGAHITISDGTTSDTMVETIPALGYYQNKNLTGVVGKTYYLTVVADGQTLTASAILLPPIKLDSLWFKAEPNKDTLGFVWAQLTDPATPGNAYRWFAKRLGKDTTYIPPNESVFNDQFFNGQKFRFAFERGQLPGSKATDDTNAESHYFKKGETVVVKFCTIDNTAYQFFNNYYFQLNNSGNPFGSPAPVPGNIQGGLGIWCGYGAYYDTVICK